MARAIKIYVACGSGIATSSVACDGVKELCGTKGIDVVISKGPISEIPTQAEHVDLILTTAKYRAECAVPLLSITSFITGIGQAATEEKLLAILDEIRSKL